MYMRFWWRRWENRTFPKRMKVILLHLNKIKNCVNVMLQFIF